MCQRDAPADATHCPEHGDTLVEVDPLLERIISRRYRLVRCVGRGGMGAVYEGRHIHTDQRVAVKVLAPHLSRDLKLVARFRREAMATSRLRHENCVQVHDFGEDDDGTFFIAMELVDGRGIGDEIRRVGALPPARVARVGVQLLGALEAAHGAGILHRDLKPQNIMLTQKVGRPDFVKVVDFGIAKFVENSPEDQAALTLPGTIFGTPEYMSPEQARGETLDGRSDLYSAAVVLWHMLLGRSPYRGKTIRETLLKVFRENPPRPSEERPGSVPRELEDALLVALAKEPRDRYPDATAFRQALLPFADAPTKAIAQSVLPGTSEDGGAPPATVGIDAPAPAREPQRSSTLLAHGAVGAPGNRGPAPASEAPVPQASAPQASASAVARAPAGGAEIAAGGEIAAEIADGRGAAEPELSSPDAPTAPVESGADEDPPQDTDTRDPITMVASLDEALARQEPRRERGEAAAKRAASSGPRARLRTATLMALVVGGGSLGGLGLGAGTYAIVRAFRDPGASQPSGSESGQGTQGTGGLAQGVQGAAGAQGAQGVQGQGSATGPAAIPDEDGWVPLEGFPSRRSASEALRLAAEALEGDDLDAAARAYAEALQGDPTSAAALQGSAMVAYRRGDLESAKRHLERLMQLGDEHAKQFRGFYVIVSEKLEAQRR